MDEQRVGFVGAGNMAVALLSGLIRAGRVKPTQIRVTDVDNEKSREAAQRHGVGVASHNQELAGWATVLILAVKPQSLPAVLDECGSSVTPQCLVVSVAAGVRSASLASLLPAGTRLVRAMPNTPAL